MRRRPLVRAGALSVALVAAAAVGNGSLSATAGSERPAFTTVPVLGGQAVDAPGGVLGVGPNVNVTNLPDAQSETTIAVDPTNKNHILSASNDLGTTTHIYESLDGGLTWAEAGLGLGSTFCYDPWLDFNSHGDAFFAYECTSGTIQRVAYRLAGQTTWVKTNLTNAGGFPDRDMIVTDDTSTSPFFDSVYLSYDDAAANNAAYVLYSRDGLANWVRSPKINGTGATIGVNAAVCPDGDVFATWLDFNGKKLWVDRSADGAATWGTDVKVHDYLLPTQNFFIFIPPQPDRGIVPMPMSTCAPDGADFEGRLYIVYTDKSPATADTNVYLRYSDNDGATWSGAVLVNDDTVDAWQFHPQVSVSQNGMVAVSFYDTRDDATDDKTHRYVAFSQDGGATFGRNLRVSSVQSDESGFGDPNDYGDYQGMDAIPRPGQFFLVWTDSRPAANAEDIFVAKVRRN